MIRYMSYTEDQMLEGCRLGQRSAQEQFYRHFQGKMLALCLRYTRDRETALDIMNRGFLRVFSKINSFQQTGSLEGWVRKIMVHAVADYFRAQNKTRITITGTISEKDESVVMPADRFARETLLQALEQLSDVQKLVFNLYAIEGYSHKEIGELAGMNDNTVRWVYAEAKKKLQQYLTPLL
ncbi:MAG: sigma-70 family RNA polymerase sigma factor [Dinghuibacter sp.]|nr:sigma-70 family RNA polymerase sigma factor [Dinghuibacter sp.]